LIGVGSILIIVLTGAFTGGHPRAQHRATALRLRSYGEDRTTGMTSLVREMGPVLGHR